MPLLTRLTVIAPRTVALVELVIEVMVMLAGVGMVVETEVLTVTVIGVVEVVVITAEAVVVGIMVLVVYVMGATVGVAKVVVVEAAEIVFVTAVERIVHLSEVKAGAPLPAHLYVPTPAEKPLLTSHFTLQLEPAAIFEPRWQSPGFPSVMMPSPKALIFAHSACRKCYQQIERLCEYELVIEESNNGQG